MKITIEVEPVVLNGNLSDKTFYAFRIVGLKGAHGDDLIVCSSDRSYPGNDAVREFINAKIGESK